MKSFLGFFSVLFTVVCFRYYIKILKRGVNVAKNKSKYVQMMVQVMTSEKPSESWTRSLAVKWLDFITFVVLSKSGMFLS